jgi:formylglycine-generating enzyme required for sulfatase activity
MEPITMLYVGSALASLVNGELSREATAELEDKRQEFQKLLEEQRQDFQRKQFEKQKELQLELAAGQRKTQLDLAADQRKTQLKLLGIQRDNQVELEELREVSQNWPLRTLRPASILKASSEAHQKDALIPLRLIPAPPIVDYDSFGAANKSFPNIEEGLAQGLRQFLSKYYPHNRTERPVELLDGAWDSKKYHGGSVIQLLHGWLKSEPILILESVIDGNYLHFRLAYWGPAQEKYSYQTLIADLPYREIVYESVKARALRWKKTQDKLIKSGKSAEEVNRLGGDNAANLKILEQEEEYRQLGIDIQQLDLQKHYKVGEQDFKYLCQFLANCHRLVAGFIADIHYLIQNNVPPLLPKLLPELTEDFYNPQLLESIVTGYRQVYQALENERPAWMPELALDLANSLKYLPDKSWAKEQVKYSFQSWLRVRGVTPPEGIEEAISAMKSVMSLEDEEYFTALQECFKEVEESLAASQIKRLLNEYASVEDYCQRVMALWKVGQLQEAMGVLNSAINRYPDYPKIRQLRQQLQEEIEERNAETNCDRAMALWQSAQLQEALLILDSAIKRYPDNPKIRQFRQFRQQLPAKIKVFEFETVTVNRQGQAVRREKKQAQSFIEDLGNGVILEMVAVSGGKFVMGSPENEENRGSDHYIILEGPQHEVTVPPFFIGKFQVTQKQWKVVVSFPKVDRDLNPDPYYPYHFQGDGRPIDPVSWTDAVEFCKRLSKKTGREYRLPSEAEWEYACRAGTTTPFYFGQTITSDLVNYHGDQTYADEPKGRYRETTTPVGQFPPNAFGLYDMHGNVWEWCADNWHDNYNGAPTNGRAWLEGGDDSRSPIRGGCLYTHPGGCRSDSRGDGTVNCSYIGFRVACGAART